MIAIVDYGMGNRRSVEKALEHVGGEPRLTADHGVIVAADGIVIPGVGAFPEAMRRFRAAGLDELRQHAAERGQLRLGQGRRCTGGGGQQGRRYGRGARELRQRGCGWRERLQRREDVVVKLRRGTGPGRAGCRGYVDRDGQQDQPVVGHFVLHTAGVGCGCPAICPWRKQR